MAGAILPISVAHGEGRAVFDRDIVLSDMPVAMRYVDSSSAPTDTYPINPNGSPEGITGLCSQDGRVTIMMPHPERVFRRTQCSWVSDYETEDSPWMQLFYNARRFVK